MLRTLALFALLLPAASAQQPPNFVVIFADDLGWGDLGVYGHPTIDTPNLDWMAFEGQRWTNFYVAAPVCTPSRAAILTGRLPIRSGMMSAKSRVLFPNSYGGLPADEVTIAEVLEPEGYRTMAVGKWHLGHLPQYLPTRQGFDGYFGIPYSNDMDRIPSAPLGKQAMWEPRSEWFNVPLLRDEAEYERPADQTTITKRYTEEAVQFIGEAKEGPFFLYLAHNLPHVPLFRSAEFEGRSLRGLYGDVIEEIDWSVGQIREALEKAGVVDRTLVVFTSDNGPWLTYFTHGGSAGPLRQGKGTTWDGGMRVPGIFWWPGHIAPKVIRGLGSTLDLLPTFAALAGAETPDRQLDGYDLSETLLEGADSPREEMFFYREGELYAARLGQWKAHFITQPSYVPGEKVYHEPPLLFHLGRDPGEQFDVAGENPEVLDRIEKLVERHRRTVQPVKDQLAERGEGASR